MKIIGLGHYSRTGKDSTANAILDHLEKIAPGIRAKKISFAWKLKQVSHELYAWAGLRDPQFYDTPEGEKLRDVVLPAIGKTPVEIWVIVGNLFRDHVHVGTWIDYVLRNDHQLDVLVIPDVRYPNEVEALRQLDAKLVKVVRPGYGPKDTVADKALMHYQDWDYVIGASGEIVELQTWASEFAYSLAGVSRWPKQSGEAKHQAYKIEAPVQPVRPRLAA